MSTKADELIRQAERGGRVAQIRAALGLNGDDFAEALNRQGKARGLTFGYDKTKVSRVESGRAAVLTAEEAIVIAELDPERRGVEWLVFGRTASRQREPRERRVG